MPSPESPLAAFGISAAVGSNAGGAPIGSRRNPGPGPRPCRPMGARDPSSGLRFLHSCPPDLQCSGRPKAVWYCRQDVHRHVANSSNHVRREPERAPCTERRPTRSASATVLALLLLIVGDSRIVADGIPPHGPMCATVTTLQRARRRRPAPSQRLRCRRSRMRPVELVAALRARSLQARRLFS